jgi:hypothetical protein
MAPSLVWRWVALPVLQVSSNPLGLALLPDRPLGSLLHLSGEAFCFSATRRPHRPWPARWKRRFPEPARVLLQLQHAPGREDPGRGRGGTGSQAVAPGDNRAKNFARRTCRSAPPKKRSRMVRSHERPHIVFVREPSRERCGDCREGGRPSGPVAPTSALP